MGSLGYMEYGGPLKRCLTWHLHIRLKQTHYMTLASRSSSPQKFISYLEKKMELITKVKRASIPSHRGEDNRGSIALGIVKTSRSVDSTYFWKKENPFS